MPDQSKPQKRNCRSALQRPSLAEMRWPARASSTWAEARALAQAWSWLRQRRRALVMAGDGAATRPADGASARGTIAAQTAMIATAAAAAMMY